MSSITPSPDDPRPLWTTILIVAIHNCLWAAWFLGLLLWAPSAERVFRDFNMKLSAMTELVFALSRWIENYTHVVGIFVFFLLAMDGMIYYRLRLSAWHFASKLWLVFMFLVPVLFIVVMVIGIWVPLTALRDGLSK